MQLRHSLLKYLFEDIDLPKKKIMKLDKIFYWHPFPRYFNRSFLTEREILNVEVEK